MGRSLGLAFCVEQTLAFPAEEHTGGRGQTDEQVTEEAASQLGRPHGPSMSSAIPEHTKVAERTHRHRPASVNRRPARLKTLFEVVRNRTRPRAFMLYQKSRQPNP
jgi:hypothetical protein